MTLHVRKTHRHVVPDRFYVYFMCPEGRGFLTPRVIMSLWKDRQIFSFEIPFYGDTNHSAYTRPWADSILYSRLGRFRQCFQLILDLQSIHGWVCRWRMFRKSELFRCYFYNWSAIVSGAICIWSGNFTLRFYFIKLVHISISVSDYSPLVRRYNRKLGEIFFCMALTWLTLLRTLFWQHLNFKGNSTIWEKRVTFVWESMIRGHPASRKPHKRIIHIPGKLFKSLMRFNAPEEYTH